jgi:hypothetical protein
MAQHFVIGKIEVLEVYIMFSILMHAIGHISIMSHVSQA